MRSSNATIRHESLGPSDDRPVYLMDGDYILAIDTETNGERWSDGGTPFLVTASDYDRDYLWVINDYHGADVARERSECRRGLLRASTWVFHNAPYDIHMLVQAGVISYDEAFERTVYDTHLMARCTFGWDVHTPDFKLKTLGKMYIGGDAADEQTELRECMQSLGLIRDLHQIKVPPDAFLRTWEAYPDVVEKYAMQDTRITYDLKPVIESKMDDSMRRMSEFERVVQPTFIRMEARGAPVNPEAVLALKQQYTEALASELDSLKARRGDDFNPNSKEDIIALFADNGIALTETTPTGEIRTDRGILDRYSGTIPEIDTILSARTHEKFLSTFVAPMEGRERVHPNFSQYGARTGRASSYDPNWQNIPVRSGPEVRNVIRSPEGSLLVVADYSSIELRLLAHYMGSDELWDVIDNGDPFLWLGEQIFGPDQAAWPVQRGPLKNGFYALTYGAGGPKLAKTIGGGMTDQEGRDLAKAIKAALGEPWWSLQKRLKATARKRGNIKTILGRTQWLPLDDRTGKVKDYVALNSLIQGSAADIMKHALTIAEADLAKHDAEIILNVHDEIVALAPEASADDALVTLKASMASAESLVTRGRLTLKVDGTTATRYGDAK